MPAGVGVVFSERPGVEPHIPCGRVSMDQQASTIKTGSCLSQDQSGCMMQA